LRFSKADWRLAETARQAAYLLALPRRGTLPGSVQRYLRHGESAGAHKGFKCRVRNPWYHVPNVVRPHAFLTYMSGVIPRLVVNAAKAVAPNTLHMVQMSPLTGADASSLAVAWHSSLTELSAELEGHALGGGMLKLEPTEAGRVVLALPPNEKWADRLTMIDPLARHAGTQTVRAAVDQFLLREGIGLTQKECRSLSEAAALLRSRRLGRRR
jgi:hypothetical protein